MASDVFGGLEVAIHDRGGRAQPDSVGRLDDGYPLLGSRWTTDWLGTRIETEVAN